MARYLILLLLLTVTAMAAQVSPQQTVTGRDSTVTFNKDVLPILQRDCQVCHRPGEAGPMSFLTFETTRPWAKAIKQAVLSKKMPPWFADSRYGDFRNRPQLTVADIETIAAWADNGAPEGHDRDAPTPIAWPTGWRIEPDVVISMQEPHRVAAKGSGEIKSFLVPNPFQQDTWVSSIEVRPGDASVVHHVMVQVPEETSAPEFSWGAGPIPCVAPRTSQFQDLNEALPAAIEGRLNGIGVAQPPAVKPPKNFAIIEAVYAPGNPPMDFGAYDSAKLIPGGGMLRIEVHYTPNGKVTWDQTRVGFKLPKEPPQRRYITLAPRSLANAQKRIPAGASNWETRGELLFGRDAQLVWLMPHMHLRGKDMTFRLIAPNGSSETILSAAFNFDWQLGYEMEQPIRVRKGTRMVVVAHHDNSANNPFNPDPSKEVAWGNLTSEEMVLPWFGVIVDRDADPETILSVRQNGCSAANAVINGPATPLPGTRTLPFPLPTFPNLGTGR